MELILQNFNACWTTQDVSGMIHDDSNVSNGDNIQR